jgi:hypothetical protein
MGDAATHSTPTFELLRELQYSMRLQAERICNGTEFLHKVGLAVLETLERERWIENEHEAALRLYLKRLKSIGAFLATLEEENAPSSEVLSTTLLSYVELTYKAQLEFESYMASERLVVLPSADEPSSHSLSSIPPAHRSPKAPLSPSNTFATTHLATVYGNPYDERGIDETLSQALPRTRVEEPATKIAPRAKEDLKSPPEDLPFEAECEVVLRVDDFETQTEVAAMISTGEVVVAESSNANEEMELDLAKALSLQEFDNDDRKPAAASFPLQTPVASPSEYTSPDPVVEVLKAAMAHGVTAVSSPIIRNAEAGVPEILPSTPTKMDLEEPSSMETEPQVGISEDRG